MDGMDASLSFGSVSRARPCPFEMVALFGSGTTYQQTTGAATARCQCACSTAGRDQKVHLLRAFSGRPGRSGHGRGRDRTHGELAGGASCQPQSELDRTPLVERGAAEPDGGEKPHGPSWAGNGVDPSAACVQAHACTEEERNGGLAETGTNKITHRMQAQDHASLRPQSCMAGQISFGSGRPIDRSAAVAL